MQSVTAKKKSILQHLSIIFFFLATGIIIFLWYQDARYKDLLHVPVNSEDKKTITFIIKKGDNVQEITDKLSKFDLIIDKNIFKSYVQQEKLDRKIAAGYFKLNKSLTIPEILEIITDSKNAGFVLTIPEGSTVRDIDKKLAEMELIEKNKFIQATQNFKNYENYSFLMKDKEQITKLMYPLEGYLFPDTYFLDPENFTTENLIDMMLKNFEKRLGDRLKTELNYSFFEIITIASIIEKEVRTTEDIPIVSGILWKRLRENIALGADATSLYLKEGQNLTYEDIHGEKPYNTREKKGLPPGPIGNPGLRSILAAFNPKETPYYYYLTPKSGEVIYSKTLQEHNQNIKKFLE